MAKAGRQVVLGGIAAVGVICIVGSGGGADLLMCFDQGPGCYGPPVPPSVVVDPSRITVQVGSPVSFKAQVFGYRLPRAYTLQWCRQPNGGAACTPIAGATAETYTLDHANLGDDGAQFTAMVVDANGSAQASGTLAVSSIPGVVFADGDFAPSTWTVTVDSAFAQPGATHSEWRSAAGGDPEAFLEVTFSVTAAPGSLRLFHAAHGAVWDPALQGTVYGIDFVVECRKLSFTGVVGELMPLIEQGPRRYVPAAAIDGAGSLCADPDWVHKSAVSVGASEFRLVAGPVCGAGESCPDFSRAGAPIRLGFATSVSLDATSSTSAVVLGIDNWRATVWPR